MAGARIWREAGGGGAFLDGWPAARVACGGGATVTGRSGELGRRVGSDVSSKRSAVSGPDQNIPISVCD
jgi:hypothetical protein